MYNKIDISKQCVSKHEEREKAQKGELRKQKKIWAKRKVRCEYTYK